MKNLGILAIMMLTTQAAYAETLNCKAVRNPEYIDSLKIEINTEAKTARVYNVVSASGLTYGVKDLETVALSTNESARTQSLSYMDTFGGNADLSMTLMKNNDDNLTLALLAYVSDGSSFAQFLECK